jgi:hypothetical protein
MRVLLDANVLFSASNKGSNIARLVRLTISRETAVTNDVAIEEARRNLALKRPGWLGSFEAILEGVERVPSVVFELPVALAAKDVPLLCAAIQGRCKLFVTGDRRDFGHLYGQTISSVEVVSLLRLAEIMAGSA